MSSPNYHLPTIAAVAGIALAASSYVMSSNSYETKRRRRRVKSKIQRGTFLPTFFFRLLILIVFFIIERDGQFILGLVNTQNYCFVNSVLQVSITLINLFNKRERCSTFYFRPLLL